jgi:hypothetical protein
LTHQNNIKILKFFFKKNKKFSKTNRPYTGAWERADGLLDLENGNEDWRTIGTLKHNLYNHLDFFMSNIFILCNYYRPVRFACNFSSINIDFFGCSNWILLYFYVLTWVSWKYFSFFFTIFYIWSIYFWYVFGKISYIISLIKCPLYVYTPSYYLLLQL